MVGHLAVGMDDPIEAPAHLPQDRQKLSPILVLEENVLPPVTPRRDVVKSGGVLQSQWSCAMPQV